MRLSNIGYKEGGGENLFEKFVRTAMAQDDRNCFAEYKGNMEDYPLRYIFFTGNTTQKMLRWYMVRMSSGSYRHKSCCR